MSSTQTNESDINVSNSWNFLPIITPMMRGTQFGINDIRSVTYHKSVISANLTVLFDYFYRSPSPTSTSKWTRSAHERHQYINIHFKEAKSMDSRQILIGFVLLHMTPLPVPTYRVIKGELNRNRKCHHLSQSP